MGTCLGMKNCLSKLERATLPHLMHLGLLSPRWFLEELLPPEMLAKVFPATAATEDVSVLLLLNAGEAAAILYY